MVVGLVVEIIVVVFLVLLVVVLTLKVEVFEFVNLALDVRRCDVVVFP